MCMKVYVAADLPLRLVPWNGNAPAFNTSLLASREGRVRAQFTKPHLLYVGSHEGCGCGFQLGEYPAEYFEPDELALRKRSLHEFAAFLREELRRVGSIEVFACWDGDQEAPAEHHRALTPSALEADGFFFLEKELSTITLDAGQKAPPRREWRAGGERKR